MNHRNKTCSKELQQLKNNAQCFLHIYFIDLVFGIVWAHRVIDLVLAWIKSNGVGFWDGRSTKSTLLSVNLDIGVGCVLGFVGRESSNFSKWSPFYVIFQHVR